MSKAKLEFDLSDPDDKLEFERTTKSLDMALSLWEFAYNTKKKIEWDIEQNNLTPYDVLDKVYENFWEILNEHDVNPEKIVQ